MQRLQDNHKTGVDIYSLRARDFGQVEIDDESRAELIHKLQVYKALGYSEEDSGVVDVINKIVAGNLGLMVRAVNKGLRDFPYLPEDILEDTCYDVMRHATWLYDPKRNSSYANYVSSSMNNRVKNLARDRAYLARQVSLDNLQRVLHAERAASTRKRKAPAMLELIDRRLDDIPHTSETNREFFRKNMGLGEYADRGPQAPMDIASDLIAEGRGGGKDLDHLSRNVNAHISQAKKAVRGQFSSLQNLENSIGDELEFELVGV